MKNRQEDSFAVLWLQKMKGELPESEILRAIDETTHNSELDEERLLKRLLDISKGLREATDVSYKVD